MRYIILLVVFIVASCHDEPDPAVMDLLGSRGADPVMFDHEEYDVTELRHTKLAKPPAIRKYGAVRWVGSRLWIRDEAGDPWIHAVDPKTGDLLYSGGRRGDQIEAFVRPGSMGAVPPWSDTLWVWDASLQRLSLMSISLDRKVLRRVMNLSTGGFEYIGRMSWLSREHIIGVSYSDSIRFWIFNALGERETVRSYPLKGTEDVPEKKRISASGGINFICGHPAGAGFVVLYGNFGRIEYYDATADFISYFEVPFPSKPLFQRISETEEVGHRPQRTWYTGCASTENRVFALFSGRGTVEYGAETISSEYIHVFKWDGTLDRIFRLDRPVTSISIGEPKGNMIYIYGISRRDPGIFVFQMPIDIGSGDP